MTRLPLTITWRGIGKAVLVACAVLVVCVAVVLGVSGSSYSDPVARPAAAVAATTG